MSKPEDPTSPYIIDGLNVCCWKKSSPSLRILLALLVKLNEKGVRFTCLFDGNTRFKLDEAERAFYQELLTTYPNCIIEVTGGIRADDFILLRADSSNSRIITNDRFRDYIDKYEWLKSSADDRLIKGSVIEDSLLVPSLHIDAQINSDINALIQELQNNLRTPLNKPLGKQQDEVKPIAKVDEPFFPPLPKGKRAVPLSNVSLGATPKYGLLGNYGGATSVAFSPDGKRIASGNGDHTIRIWDIYKGRMRVLGKCEGVVLSVVFSADGKSILSGSEDKIVRIWDVDTGQEQKFGVYGIPHLVNFFNKDDEIIVGLESYPGNKLFASHIDFIETLDAKTGKQKHNKIELSFDGECVFSTGTPMVVAEVFHEVTAVWDITAGKAPKYWRETGFNTGLAFSSNGSDIACGDPWGNIYIWNLEQGTFNTLVKFEKLTGKQHYAIGPICFSSDGKTIAACAWPSISRENENDWEKDIVIFTCDVLTGQANLLGSLSASSLAFSPDAKSLAIGSYEDGVHLWGL